MQRKTLLLITLFVASSVSCTSESVDLCRHPYDRIFGDAILALRPWQLPAGRTLASVPSVGDAKFAELSRLDRQTWQEWSVARLKETQHVMDQLRADPGTAPMRASLSSVADKLVAFHGYCGIGRVDRMVSTLEKLQAQSAEIRAQACR